MYAFVLGSGCCGSSLIQEILTRHREVAFLSNLEDRLPSAGLLRRLNRGVYDRVPQAWTQKGRLRFAPSEGYRILSSQVSPLIAYPGRSLTAEDASPWLAERFEGFFETRRRSQGKPVFLHKFTGYSRAGFVEAVLPGTRYIHIVRDGRAVASSLVRRSWWAGELGQSQVWATTGLSPAYRDEWERSGRSFPLLAGLTWKSLIDDHELARQSLPPGSWLELRYEDILTDPRRHFVQMLGHIGLEPDAAFTRTLDSYALDGSRTDSYRHELDSRSLELLEKSLGAHLGRLGYPACGAEA